MKKGELTRQHIIAKAAPVFNQRGFAGASMTDLMEATGLEKGGLYRHFTSKEELAIESFKYAVQQVRDARSAGIEQGQDAITRLRHIVRAFVQVPSPIPGGCPMMNAAADADTSSKAILAVARKGIISWKSELCKILDEGIRHGQVRSNVEPRRIANTLISMLEGALVISRLEGTREAMVDAQASLESLLLTLVP
jgi:TetR/AcrR family transcriptional repressor of nem operon